MTFSIIEKSLSSQEKTQLTESLKTMSVQMSTVTRMSEADEARVDDLENRLAEAEEQLAVKTEESKVGGIS